MVPDSAPSTLRDRLPAETESNALIYGLVVGGVGIVLSAIPLSTLLGGIVAGYLEGGRFEDGLKAGAVAGVVMFVPFVFLFVLLLAFLGFGGAPMALGVFGAVALVFVAAYTVGLAVLGGYLGVYIRREL